VNNREDFNKILEIGINREGKILIRDIDGITKKYRKKITTKLELEDIDELKLIFDDNTITKFIVPYKLIEDIFYYG
jgi:hypothetical protein